MQALLPTLAVAVASLCGALSGQPAKPVERPGALLPPDAGKVDPFTKGDPLTMLKAGYLSFGPFELGDGHDTKKVEELLGDLGIAWAETAHFKIGCSLSPLTMPTGRDGNTLSRELEELKKVLPAVDPRPKYLPTWLRLHLYARRLEALYADFEKRIGVGDDEFPTGPEQVDYKNYKGEGPYLGQRGKYVVLLFDRASSFARYARAFFDNRQRYTIRHHFRLVDSLLLMTCEEFAEGRFREEAALHAHVVFNAVHLLLDGYHHYNHDLPAWFSEGFAQWHVRRLDPRFTSWNAVVEYGTDWRPITEWAPMVRNLLTTKSVPPGATTMRWWDFESPRFSDRVVFWSRVDWVLSLGDKKLKAYLDTMKEPFDRASRLPSRNELIARQDEALKKAWGLDVDSFDQYWSAWALKTYQER